jgi:hypothetical protein
MGPGFSASGRRWQTEIGVDHGLEGPVAAQQADWFPSVAKLDCHFSSDYTALADAGI